MTLGMLAGLLPAAALGLAAGDEAIERLAAAVVAAQAQVSRLEFDCLLTSRGGGGGEVTDRYNEALAARRRFAETIHQDRRDAPPWLDPHRNVVWARPEGATMLRVFERSVRSYGPGAIEALRSSPYTDCIGWRPPGEPAAAATTPGGGRRFFLLDVFAPDQVASLRLRPGGESVDGLRCVVVEARDGRDVLWICPARGHALVRRVIRRDDQGDEVEYRAGRLKQVAAGIWLPTVCEGEFRTPKGTPARRGFRLEVRHLAVNGAIPDSRFQPSFPPGTLVFDREGRLEQGFSGGAELLDLWVAVALSLLPPQGQPVSPRSGAFVMYLFGGVILAWGWWLIMLARAREAGEPPTVEARARPPRVPATE